MKWYDEKVVAAQLINAILGIFDNKIDLFTLSLNADLIKQELNKLVEKVIENDDEIINDCFFAFSNDTYNSMLQTSELRRMGIYTNDEPRMLTMLQSSDTVLLFFQRVVYRLIRLFSECPSGSAFS